MVDRHGMRVHPLMVLKGHFQEILDGRRTFHLCRVRRDGAAVREFDSLHLYECDPTAEPRLTGRSIECSAGAVDARTPDTDAGGLKGGWQIISLADLPPAQPS